ncbi:hypothetical protein OS493_013150 [Desmophyllum pertusum]|uniref:Uncharacterized protein n=1 Tax=Desmophyllum pertusum TaxID=174260 RepID=A0A9X0CLF7_9CNID|nr:hypothetical protein OS493_013150 [Desmophyllum pertusum]
MKEPLESSQFSCMVSPADRSELSPVLMMACFQHHVEGENNKVRCVSMSSYEPSTEKDVTLLKNKRDVLAVCLAHLVVIWTVVPGLQWTVLHKWTLPTDGAEEFMSVQVVPMNSHVVLLVGGISMVEMEGDYSFNLKHDDKRSEKASFSTMCLLHDTTMERNIDVDVELFIGNRTSHLVMLTKWTLDSFCLLVEQQQSFTPITTDSDLLSLQAVRGSHCLLLGTTDDKLFLWNHKTCQQLRSICLHTMGFGQLSCLKAFTD